ncbi:MAG: hypothetical protein GX490_09210 [Bacilli bacterium]|nr:hypothetical protein [Bacilli bacterium]
MKVYEYARIRGVKSRDVVRKLKELGYKHVKNHLSLVPEKIIPDLDLMEIASIKKKEKPKPKLSVIVSLECAPFKKEGIGDLVYQKLRYCSLDENQAIVIMPRYHLDSQILERAYDLVIEVNHNEYPVSIYQTTYKGNLFFFIANPLFERDLIYGYVDDPIRFAIFTKASVEVIKRMTTPIDIINIHDWPLGFFPLLFEEEYNNANKPLIEFSVYGPTYQGIYGVEVLIDVFGLDKKYFYDNHLAEYAHSVNFLKTGLVTCDMLDVDTPVLELLRSSYLREFIYDNKLKH